MEVNFRSKNCNELRKNNTIIKNNLNIIKFPKTESRWKKFEEKLLILFQK